MTTKEAFEKLISKRGWYSELGINFNSANLAAKRFRDGNLSNDKMEELLEKAGFKVLSEKQWELTDPVISLVIDRLAIRVSRENSPNMLSMTELQLTKEVPARHPDVEELSVSLRIPTFELDMKKLSGELKNYYWQVTIKSFEK